MQNKFQDRPRLNNQIRVPQVQVIDADGKALGAMPTHQALALANERGLDLVEVGPNANPPVAKIIDYGKFMYQREKKERETKPKTTSQEVKTVKIGFKTSPHDLGIRMGQIDKFLQKGYRVRIELFLRGRERGLGQLARVKLEEFAKTIGQPHAIEVPLRQMPNNISMVIKPAK